MKLVILDSYTTVSTDLSLDCLRELVDSMEVYERTPPEQTAARIGDAELVLTNKTVLSREVLEQCPNVAYIGLFATGYNVIDVDYCRERGIVVSNAPAYSTNAVAQMVFAFLLRACSMVARHDREVHEGRWQTCRDFTFYDPAICEVAGKTIGIIGAGSIGRKVMQLARAFDMNVLFYSRTVYPELENDFVHFVSLETLLQTSDVVTLHCPLFPETKELMNRERLAMMKPSALLINTARGGVIDEQAVADALRAGTIRYYAADVTTVEPISPDNPLLNAPNCVLTPHIAWAAKEARARLIGIVRENLLHFLQGHPTNNVAGS